MSESSSRLHYWAGKMLSVLKEEVGQLRPRQHLLSLVARAIPSDTGHELRTTLLRLRGIQIGKGTLIYDTPELSGGESRGFANLSIGCNCVIDVGCMFELGDRLTIGDDVRVGCQALIITSTHELGPREHRAGKLVRSPVTIGDGAWIGSRCVILPGVTIGAGAIVDPGSVVNRDVAPQTRARGIPARRVED